MKRKILICGLPGSGKSTLAKKLTEYLGDADWWNADEVRKQANDWDFSPEGRYRQMDRMRSLTQASVDGNRYAVADFVCPTSGLRSEFNADYVVWMNTIEKGRFDDTNKVFMPVENADAIITKDEWWEDKWIDHHAKVLSVKIRTCEFVNNLPTVQMLGRFQPFHDGHRALFQRAHAKTGQVVIFIRDMPTSDSNPWTAQQMADNCAKELFEYAGSIKICVVPNIVNITYGRDVGYKIEQEVFDDATHAISATKIREEMRKK